MRTRTLAFAFLLLGTLVDVRTVPAETVTPEYTNSLVNETSPYLLQHAHNPVDWHPWGETAFTIAQQQQKPIFLSVGYSSCHWCLVMERKVFQDPAIARDLNEKFVCIKVDREQRPEIDHVYMIAQQIMSRNGGWPLNAFLTPPAPESAESDRKSEEVTSPEGYGLKPFFCATYLPPVDEEGSPGFPRVVEALHKAWKADRKQVLAQAERWRGRSRK